MSQKARQQRQYVCKRLQPVIHSGVPRPANYHQLVVIDGRDAHRGVQPLPDASACTQPRSNYS